MPRYFLMLWTATGFLIHQALFVKDTDAIIRATVLAQGVSLDMPEDGRSQIKRAISNDASGQFLIALQFALDFGLVVQDRVQQ
jgi:hypothetical protein